MLLPLYITSLEVNKKMYKRKYIDTIVYQDEGDDDDADDDDDDDWDDEE